MRKSLMLWLLCWTIAGCQNSSLEAGTSDPPGRPEKLPRPFAEGIELSTTELGLEQGLVATKFNFAQTRDLWVRVKLAGMGRFTRLTLSFIDPSGNVFFEDYLMFSPDANQAQTINMDKEQSPVNPTTVFPAKKLVGGLALDHPIAIDGTNFTRYPQPGTWQVRARIGDSPRTFTSQFEVVFKREE